MTRLIIPALVALLVSGCAVVDVITSSEDHISLIHDDSVQGVEKTLKIAKQHCRQYGKTAVQIGSNDQSSPPVFIASSFRCE